MELQKYFSKFLPKKRKQKISGRDHLLHTKISKLIGHQIQNVQYYREAFTLKNPYQEDHQTYERLEFLGDSILGSIISWHLFNKYETANEGFLTQMKSKIVNRKYLNEVGEGLKITDLIVYGRKNILSANISGNLLEALIGAIYLDLGFAVCTEVVLSKLLTPEKIASLEGKIVSYKSLLLEWSQKTKQHIRYETKSEQNSAGIAFRCRVYLKDKLISNATESSKKKAEEKAAQRAFYCLNKKEDILGSSKNNI